MCLAALMGFCTRRGIEPAQLTDAVLDAFERWLTARTLQAEPQTVRTAARRAWNKAVKEIDGPAPDHAVAAEPAGPAAAPLHGVSSHFSGGRRRLPGQDGRP